MDENILAMQALDKMLYLPGEKFTNASWHEKYQYCMVVIYLSAIASCEWPT